MLTQDLARFFIFIFLLRMLTQDLARFFTVFIIFIMGFSQVTPLLLIVKLITYNL